MNELVSRNPVSEIIRQCPSEAARGARAGGVKEVKPDFMNMAFIRQFSRL